MPRRGEANNVQHWKETFVWLMKKAKPQDKWTLEVSDDPGAPPRGWYTYDERQLFARFECSHCSKEWKSIQVVVRFRVHLEKSGWASSQGQVTMRTFRQKCHRCSKAKYEEPIFSDEMIEKLLQNLVLKILEKCYREPQKPSHFVKYDPEEDVDGPHDRDNCEACEKGVCLTRSGFAAQPVKQKQFQDILVFLLTLFVIFLLLIIGFFSQNK